jgi:hypothetical protein
MIEHDLVITTNVVNSDKCNFASQMLRRLLYQNHMFGERSAKRQSAACCVAD